MSGREGNDPDQPTGATIAYMFLAFALVCVVAALIRLFV